MRPDPTAGIPADSTPANEEDLRELLARAVDDVAGVLRREPTVTDVLSTLSTGLSRAASRVRPRRRAPLTETEANGWTQHEAVPGSTDGVRVNMVDGRVSVTVEVSAHQDHQTLAVAADVHDTIVTELQQHRHVVEKVTVTIVEVREELARVQS
ncbi:MAG: hypothetical protein ACTHZ5_09615 [Micrococcaceae bacterium]